MLSFCHLVAQAMCDARCVFTAVSCIAPGSTNDRQAWTLAGFDDAIAALPDQYFVVGDAAYGASEKMLVPYPGTNLDSSRAVSYTHLRSPRD